MSWTWKFYRIACEADSPSRPGQPSAVQQQREAADARADRHHAGVQPLVQAGPHCRGTVHLRARAVSTLSLYLSNPHTHTHIHFTTQRAAGQMFVSRGVEGHRYCPLGGLEIIIPSSPGVCGRLGGNNLQSQRTDGVEPAGPPANNGRVNSTKTMRSLLGIPASG